MAKVQIRDGLCLKQLTSSVGWIKLIDAEVKWVSSTTPKSGVISQSSSEFVNLTRCCKTTENCSKFLPRSTNSRALVRIIMMQFLLQDQLCICQ